MFCASVIDHASGVECTRGAHGIKFIHTYILKKRKAAYLESQEQERMQTSIMSIKLNIWLLCSVICACVVQASQSVCSSQNTATTDGVRDQFQSNGWCSNNCAGHQFAIVQGFMCWCSDTEPSTQTSVNDCSGTCPGYGYEDCGNVDKDLFGYIYLGQEPLSSLDSMETSTIPSEHSFSSSATSSLTSILVSTKASPAPTSTSAYLLAPVSISTTSVTPTLISVTSSASTSTSTTLSTSTTTSTTSSVPITLSIISLAPTITSTTSSTTTSTSSTTTSTASSVPTTTSTTLFAPTTMSTSSSTTTKPMSTTSSSAAVPSTTVTYTSITASPTTSTITSVNLQTSLKYSVTTVTSVHTMDRNVSEITSRYLTMTKIITQIYSSPSTETSTSLVATTSASVGGRITNNNNNNNNSNNNNNNNSNSGSNSTVTNKSTNKKSYWRSPGKIAATFVVVGVVCLVIICVLIYLIYHYRTRPARKAQDFENEYQSKFSQSKYPKEMTTTTLHTPSPSSNSTFSTPRLIYTDEKGQIMSQSPSPRQSTHSLTAGSPLNDPSALASPFRDPTLSRRASTFFQSPIQKNHEKMESNVTLGEDTVLVDQRLDPSKMLNTLVNDDATNHSAISLSDNVDYSRRVLRVMNE